ncbi:MAG: DNA polymerase III subunit epsilon, partial [Betaproteobacteria bacterium]
TIDVLADEGLLASYGPVDPSELVVLTASAEEVAAHEAVLAGIEKESKAVPVWRAVPAATPA